MFFLFKSLGFDLVESMDFSGYENPTYIQDLNNPVPDELLGKYDAIYDGGTLEHVFNFPGALENVHKMLKPGGVIIHSSPSTNHVDHGFYMFSPTVFCDYYAKNGYKIIKSFIFEYEQEHDTKPWIIYDYHPGSIDHLSFGGWGDKLLGIWFVAQKQQCSTCGIIPQQGSYVDVWARSKNASGSVEETDSVIKALVKNNKLLHGFLRPFVFRFRKFFKTRRPPVVAIY